MTVAGSSWFLPSSESSLQSIQLGSRVNGSRSVDEREGDSGFSDGATTPASGDDSQEAFSSLNSTGCHSSHSSSHPTSFSSSELFTFAHSSTFQSSETNPVSDPSDELVHLDSDVLERHLPDNQNDTAAAANNDQNNAHDDDDDNLSTISGLSDLSGADWKPSAGPFSWVQHHMMKGTDPRTLLKDMISSDSVIPDHLDQLTMWKIILNMVSEPPRRKKLDHINTLEDVVHLINTSRKIVVLTGAGVSVSCGIPDFRSRDGVYARLAVDFPDLPDPQVCYFRH